MVPYFLKNRQKTHVKNALVFMFVIIALSILPGQVFSLDFDYLTSISTNNGKPIRIAINNSGQLYVASPQHGKILVFSQDGSYVNSINGFEKPLSVAVDSSDRIYVGDVKNGSVSVVSIMNTSNQFLFSLGSGKGEFGMPGDITITSNGYVYVTDSTNNMVKVYAPDGTFQFSFGGYGVDPGQMNFPTGITSDDTNQEIYVVDHNNGRVEVFDLNGNFKRSFGSYGSGPGRFTRPHGIHVSDGRVYVVDAYQSTVQVFDRDGTFIAFAGQFGSEPGDLKIPLDVTTSRTKLYVTNSENGRIEVFDIPDPQGLNITPSTLSFTPNFFTNPPQSVQIDPKVEGTSLLQWTATVSSSFIKLSQFSGTAPSTVTVDIDITGLLPGDYTGTVLFRSDNGTDYPLTVNLTILNPSQLFVSPNSLDMLYQIDGDLVTKPLSINSSEDVLEWTAATDNQWLTLSTLSGTTPADMTVSLNENVNNLAEGTYNANVTVNAPGALGSPVTVPLTLKVIFAGTIIVNSNLDEASFTINGPTTDGSTTYTGSGKYWKDDEVRPGTYSIQFGYVIGFRRPASETFEIKTGQTVTIDGLYQPLPVANIIVAAKGPSPKNDALVRVLDLEGNLINEFMALTTKYGARIATSDIDGDGSDEIIVTPGPGPKNKALISIFRYDGTDLTSTGPIANTRYGADVAVGDIDGDGSLEIAISMVSADKKSQTVIIYSVDLSYEFIEKTKLTLTEKHIFKSPANLAFGDVDGDGWLDLIVSNIGEVSIYVFDKNMSPSLLTAEYLSNDPGKDYKPQMTVSAGDVNGDGIDEITFGYTDNKDSMILVYGNLTDYGLSSINAFEEGKSYPNLSMMDWDGDGISEILAGHGNHPNNPAIVRIYGSNGGIEIELNAFEGSSYGVNAVFGGIK